MKTDTQHFESRSEDLRRQVYDGEVLFVADLGTDVGDATVDVVDGTAIVVTEAGEQREFALPEEVQGVTINNGVLTVEVAR